MTSIDVKFIRDGDRASTSISVEVPDELSVREEVGSLSEKARTKRVYGMFKILTVDDNDCYIVWNRLVTTEVKAAKEMFLELTGHGLVPHNVSSNGDKNSDAMNEFDPDAEEIFFLPVTAVTINF